VPITTHSCRSLSRTEKKHNTDCSAPPLTFLERNRRKGTVEIIVLRSERGLLDVNLGAVDFGIGMSGHDDEKIPVLAVVCSYCTCGVCVRALYYRANLTVTVSRCEDNKEDEQLPNSLLQALTGTVAGELMDQNIEYQISKYHPPCFIAMAVRLWFDSLTGV
jgi:hypothetical protein